ncbi:hypothetical protein BD413DRAFT_15522 [Trametes elegans]|nr:hypothetical protein BD413DRAFT_15522 [Trametes elegans]
MAILLVAGPSRMEQGSDKGEQTKRSEEPVTRPTLQRSHSLTRILTRSDDPSHIVSTPPKPACGTGRSRRPALRRSVGFRDGGRLERSFTAPVSMRHKPSRTMVLRVIILDLCVSVKEKCTGNRVVPTPLQHSV